MTDLHASWKPDVPLAPGGAIREILDERGIPQVDFAARMGKSEKFVSQPVNGKAPISYETAIELERVLGVPASFWNAAEATYHDLLAHQRASEEAGELAEWTRSFPLKEKAEQGWIAQEATPSEQAEELLSFFGVSSVDAYRAYWSAGKRLAARMGSAHAPETSAIAAWLRAATRLTPAEWLPLVTERCAEAGIAVVFLPRTLAGGA